ncbi:protein of unknown function [endosymbiont DhMRE of Dentiscutata heterogama]|uniref:hypothetical protein n=1 Tax=endosymbiont DhMRE of Dentiscutata heterogama TaxID=1609546 RepID=UPI000638CBA0|nr:hypothetical protein [endosymbiont DhMRE of Dentiscutata heterogama]CFW92718.1 protein of unknown function [endosymbiont DhMRE of Dentiscutata heterogama]
MCETSPQPIIADNKDRAKKWLKNRENITKKGGKRIKIIIMREILLIKTSESQKIKALLDQNNTDYEIVYKDTISISEEEIWRHDAYLASQDKEREQELKEWDKVTSKINDE